MDLQSYRNILRDIYGVANTPAFLYDTMRKSPIVSKYLTGFDDNTLFREFDTRVKSPINDASDIAILYAIMGALSFKRNKDVIGFFKRVKDGIKFEWFSNFAEFYLTNQPTSSTFTFQISPSGITEAPTPNTKFEVK